MNISLLLADLSKLNLFVNELYDAFSKTKHQLIFLNMYEHFDVKSEDLTVFNETEVKVFSDIPSVNILKCRFCGNCARQCNEQAFLFEQSTSAIKILPWLCVACDDCFSGCRLKDALVKQSYQHGLLRLLTSEQKMIAFRKYENCPEERERETSDDLFFLHAGNQIPEHFIKIFTILSDNIFLPVHILNSADIILYHQSVTCNLDDFSAHKILIDENETEVIDLLISEADRFIQNMV